MKNYSIFLLLLISAINLHAQDYQISFTGTGASATVDSVKVENLTQGKSITLGGSEALHLVKTITGINLLLDYENTFRIYPNPMTDNSTIDFVATASGTATIELFETNGKRVGKIQSILTIGAHSFNVSGLCRGIYTVRISSNAYTYTGKLISNGEPGSDVTIGYKGKRDIPVIAKSLMITNAEKTMQYTTGDRLKITGKSGNYSTVCTDVPTQSKTISFTFVACTDADGNNYSVVQIGSQVWMAENLKTTKYRNGDPIPNVTDNTKWSNISTGAYCDYNNTPGNSAIYGKLYNWYAVDDSRNIAPTGWHGPTDAEWTILTDYLIANGYNWDGTKNQNKIAKALASTTNWASSPYEGEIGTYLTKNNSAGFTALPGGYRYSNGFFDSIGNYGLWWSSTEYSTSNAYRRSLYYSDTEIGRDYDYKKCGYSVRLVRD
jgi:uncharacterized protein (TIGR02145 family)